MPTKKALHRLHQAFNKHALVKPLPGAPVSMGICSCGAKIGRVDAGYAKVWRHNGAYYYNKWWARPRKPWGE